jgi:hypothetical protein
MSKPALTRGMNLLQPKTSQSYFFLAFCIFFRKLGNLVAGFLGIAFPVVAIADPPSIKTARATAS